MGNGAQVDILQLASSWHTTRQTRDSQTAFFEHFGNHVGCCLTLTREIGGQNDFLDQAVVAALRQFFKSQIFWPNAIEWAEFAHQHKVQASEGRGSLNGRLISGRFNHTQLRTISFWIGAHVANFRFGECVTCRAVPNMIARMF